MQLFLQSLVTQPKLQGCVVWLFRWFVVIWLRFWLWLFRPGIVVSVRIHPRHPRLILCLQWCPLILCLLLPALYLRLQLCLRLCWDLLVPRELILARFLSFVQPPSVGSLSLSRSILTSFGALPVLDKMGKLTFGCHV